MTQFQSGDFFRAIREGRNLTLKEAAGDTISAQSLSKYEKDDGNLRVSDFIAILNNMAFPPQEYFRLHGNLDDPISELIDTCKKILDKNNYSKVIELARQIPAINKEQKLRSHYEAQLLRTYWQTDAVSYTLESLDLLTEEDYQALEYVLGKMKDRELWNEVETHLYTKLLAALPDWRDKYFTAEFILSRAQATARSLEKRANFDSDSYELSLFSIYFTVRYLMMKDRFLEAENLLHQSKPLTAKCNFVTLVQYYTEEAFLNLRKGDPKAIKMCEKLLTFIDNYETLTESGFYSTFRQSFLISANMLNNTGEKLEF